MAEPNLATLVADTRRAANQIDELCLGLLIADLHPWAIAAALNNLAGTVWRHTIPDEAERRKVIFHAAEVAITGKMQWSERPNPSGAKHEQELNAALATILDAVDYTAGNCGPTEMVGAVLDSALIEKARRALRGQTS